MSDLSGSLDRGVRRRADARRSEKAILEAALAELSSDPSASVDKIAASARVSRQTIYAHFGSRDGLLETLLDRLTERTMEVLDAAGLDALPAPDAIARLIELSFDQAESTPGALLAVMTAPDRERERERHQPVLERLDRIVRRGQRKGELDARLQPAWIRAAIVAVAHATADEVRGGRLERDEALQALTRALRRMFEP